MSEERELIDTATGQVITAAAREARSPEEIKAIRATRKAQLVKVLDRGVTVDRLQVNLPPDMYGEWIPNDKLAIAEAQAKGFVIDTEFAPRNALHDQGDGRTVVGDAVFMTLPKMDKELIDEIRQEQFNAANGKGPVRTHQKEESDFSLNTARQGLPVVDESRDRAARKADIQAALSQEQKVAAVPQTTVIR